MPPVISSLSRTSGPVGSVVTITGTGFGATQGTSTVTFNAVAAAILSWSATSIRCSVPATAMTGPVIVTVSAVASNSVTFNVTTPSNGGTIAPLGLLLIPAGNGINAAIYTLDPENFNDPNSGSYYNWKVEDVTAGTTPTMRRIIFSYRDLGPVTFTATVTFTNDAGQVESVFQVVSVGNASPTNKILTKIITMTATGQNLQLSVTRAAGAGPLSITKVRIFGTVETTKY